MLCHLHLCVDGGKRKRMVKSSTDADASGEADAAPTKRRASARQASKISNSASKDDKAGEAAAPAKRRAPAKQASQSSSSTKKAEALDKSEDTEEHSDDSVVINRAPVLALWTAVCLMHSAHIKSLDHALTIGKEFSGLLAKSKIQAMRRQAGGTTSSSSSSSSDKADRKAARERADSVGVFHTKMPIVYPDNDSDEFVALDVSTNKPDDPQKALKYIQNAFQDDLDRVTKAFHHLAEAVIKANDGDTDAINHIGYELYEHFRPSPKRGDFKIGQKNELSLRLINELADTPSELRVPASKMK